MSCNYCGKSRKSVIERYYARPSGMQYELNQFTSTPKGPNAGPKSVGGAFYMEVESDDGEDDEVVIIPTQVPDVTPFPSEEEDEVINLPTDIPDTTPYILPTQTPCTDPDPLNCPIYTPEPGDISPVNDNVDYIVIEEPNETPEPEQQPSILTPEPMIRTPEPMIIQTETPTPTLIVLPTETPTPTQPSTPMEIIGNVFTIIKIFSSKTISKIINAINVDILIADILFHLISILCWLNQCFH